MKIAILTMVFNNNYGGMLQAYALMQSLKKIGHTPVLLNVQRDSKRTFLRKFLSIVKRFFYKYILSKDSIYSIFYQKEIGIFEKNTNYFINKYIQPKSLPIYNSQDFIKVAKLERFEAYIVGSDQVWRPTMYPFIDEAFFNFLGEEKNEIRLSYAASFGVDRWEYTELQTDKFKKQIQLFDAVSVREDSAVSLCNKYFDKNAIHVIDPTMLLSITDYIKITEDESELHNSETLLVYMLDSTKDKQKTIHHLADTLGQKPFYTNVKSKIYKGDVSDHVYPTVTSWLRGFIDAKYVFTDSYHGCVFAILFNKPFIVYGNSQRGFARFYSLLKMFGLESRYIESFENLTEEQITEPIEWSKVNDILDQQRKIAYDFLENNLK